MTYILIDELNPRPASFCRAVESKPATSASGMHAAEHHAVVTSA